MTTKITRSLVKAARGTKVLIERLVTSTVRLHGKALDARANSAVKRAESITDSAHILKAAAAARFDDADCAWDTADEIAEDVRLEKQSLGL